MMVNFCFFSNQNFIKVFFCLRWGNFEYCDSFTVAFFFWQGQAFLHFCFLSKNMFLRMLLEWTHGAKEQKASSSCLACNNNVNFFLFLMIKWTNKKLHFFHLALGQKRKRTIDTFVVLATKKRYNIHLTAPDLVRLTSLILLRIHSQGFWNFCFFFYSVCFHWGCTLF